MGMQDRDWYIEAQKEREKRELLERTKSLFTSRSNRGTSPSQSNALEGRNTPQLGLVPMMLFWFAVMGVLYVLMNQYMKQKEPRITATGDLVITRASNGHFYAPGTINGYPVMFMVDTGATHVAISKELAQKANLKGGLKSTFRTANGDREGRIFDGVNVSFGPVLATNITVGAGIQMGGGEADALLGQSFLSKFKITMHDNTMTLTGNQITR
jgi:aspartyl protease family protein